MKAYDIVDKRSGQEKAEASVRQMISRADIIVARNAAFVEFVNARDREPVANSATINFLSGKMHALNDLVG